MSNVAAPGSSFCPWWWGEVVFQYCATPQIASAFTFPEASQSSLRLSWRVSPLLDPSSDASNHIALSYFPWKGSHSAFACSRHCTAFATSMASLHILMPQSLASSWGLGGQGWVAVWFSASTPCEGRCLSYEPQALWRDCWLDLVSSPMTHG